MNKKIATIAIVEAYGPVSFNMECKKFIEEGFEPLFPHQVVAITTQLPGYHKSEYKLIYTQQWVKYYYSDE